MSSPEMISKTWQEEIYFLDGENSAQSMLALRVHVEDLGVVPMVMILKQFVESMCVNFQVPRTDNDNLT